MFGGDNEQISLKFSLEEKIDRVEEVGQRLKNVKNYIVLLYKVKGYNGNYIIQTYNLFLISIKL